MFSDAGLREAVAEAHEAPVDEVVPVEAGRNHGYRVAFRDGTELFLKVATRFPEAFAAEPRTMAFVRRETNIPVPRVHAVGENPLDYPFAVYDHVEDAGYDWVRDLPRGTAERLCREAGEHLAALHRQRFPEFGRLGAEGDALAVVQPRAYDEVLRESLDRQLSDLRDTPFVDRRDALEALGTDRIDAVDCDAVAPALVHGDYRLDNLRLDPVGDRVTAAVLDWELPTAADPLWDAVMTLTVLTEGYGVERGDRRAYRDAFWEGYGDVPSGTARWHCYELLARIRLARHLDTEMEGKPDASRSERVAEHRDAFDELLDGGSRFERSPHAR